MDIPKAHKTEILTEGPTRKNEVGEETKEQKIPRKVERQEDKRKGGEGTGGGEQKRATLRARRRQSLNRLQRMASREETVGKKKGIYNEGTREGELNT